MMTVDKLSAGDGYNYLTRQVASHEQHRGAGTDLTDYYLATGNPPGCWIGSGAAALGVSGDVREAQMRALFGAGRHPDSATIVAAQLAAGTDPVTAERATRLGRAFPGYGTATARKAVAGYDLVFTPVKSVSVLWALGGPDVRRAVEEARREAVDLTLAWLERHAAFARTGRRWT